MGPAVRSLAEKTLAEWPETNLLDPQSQAARDVKALLDHLRGGVSFLDSSVLGIQRLIKTISTRDAQLTSTSPEIRAQLDWTAVRGLVSGGKSFTDFSERTAALEAVAKASVKKALDDERQGKGAPVSTGGPPVSDENLTRIIRNVGPDDA